MLESQTYPRDKPCGGALSPRILDIIDFDISPVVDRVLSTAVIHSPSGREVVCRRDDVAGQMVKRAKFDHFLAERAREAGVSVVENMTTVAVEQVRGGVRVLSPGDSFKGKILVGADGVNGIVAREIDVRWGWPDEEVAFCIVGTVHLDSDDIEWVMSVPGEPEGVAMDLYFGIQHRGYGWVFPKRDELSIGIGCRMDLIGDIRSEWGAFTERIREEKGIHLDFLRKDSFRVPVGRTGSRFTGRRTLLVGDAAGLVSPVTGEGVYYAIYSGRIAAEVIAEAARRKSPLYLKEYDVKIKQKIIPELETAEFMADVLFRSERNSEIVCEIASEDTTMRNLMIDFVTGSRPPGKMRISIAKRLFTRHPLKTIRLGLNV
jgi:geranylgeranyl reductase family protein